MNAREDDPSESHAAACAIEKDGTASRMRENALFLVRLFPGATANELEQAGKLKDGQIRKRLNELRRQGLARNGAPRLSAVTGKRNATWYANPCND